MLGEVAQASACSFHGADASVRLETLTAASSLGGRIEQLRGRSVLIATEEPLAAALALTELDGVARRLIVCPPDLSRGNLLSVVSTAQADAVVSDTEALKNTLPAIGPFVTCSATLVSADGPRNESQTTEWILFTSGTTGMPKMAVHTLASLAGAVKSVQKQEFPPVWATFYDIRRYGGMQILLRAIFDGGAMVLRNARESVGDYLVRAGRLTATHVSGTPSHWRRALMSPSAHELAPRYVRLSGEIVDQEILDRLRAFYGDVRLVHAYASTEAGVGFEVTDGLAGFPARLVSEPNGEVAIKIEDGSLRIGSARNATRYLGAVVDEIKQADGLVDTQDMVELRGDRYYFVGRRDGTINVGGLKVHPEEVEAVINRHPNVQMSLVKARSNPIIGALVVADVVLKPGPRTSDADAAREVRKDIIDTCRAALAPHKVPTSIRIVPSLEVTASGKLARV